jgi:uncharacterized protein YbaA (DUF1428 family)
MQCDAGGLTTRLRVPAQLAMCRRIVDRRVHSIRLPFDGQRLIYGGFDVLFEM